MVSKKTKKIALFLGNDVTSHLIANKVVPEIIDCAFTPTLFMVQHPHSDKANLPALQELAFFERVAINDIIYPLLKQHAHRNGHPVSPQKLAETHTIEIHSVNNVNNQKFIQQDNFTDYVGAVNIRGFQKYHLPIIELFQEKGFFLNLHPGLLPEYRGVLSLGREMVDGLDQCGWVLHHVDENWDTGDIVSVHPHIINKDHTILEATIDMAQTGAKAIARAVEDLEGENVLARYPQKESTAHYYSYPTADELLSWKEQDIMLCDPERMPKILTNIFVNSTSPLGKTIQSKIKEEYQTLQNSFNGANTNDRKTSKSFIQRLTASL